MIKIILETNIKIRDVYGNSYGFSKITNTKNGKYCYYDTNCYENHKNDLKKYFDWDEMYTTDNIHNAKRYNELYKYADKESTFDNIEETLKYLGVRIKTEGEDNEPLINNSNN